MAVWEGKKYKLDRVSYWGEVIKSFEEFGANIQEKARETSLCLRHAGFKEDRLLVFC